MSSLLRGCARRGDHAVEAMHWLFDRAGNGVKSQEIHSLLRYAAEIFRLRNDVSTCILPRTRMIKLLLDRGQDSDVTEDVLLAATTYPRQWGCPKLAVTLDPESYIMPLLVERAEDSQLTEGVLMAVAHNGWSDIMQLLLRRVDTTNITQDVVVEAVGNLELGVILQFLALLEEIHVTDDLLEAAAANYECNCELVEILLTKSSAISLPKDVLLTAADSGPEEAVWVWEDGLGPAGITEAKLAAIVRGCPRIGNLVHWL